MQFRDNKNWLVGREVRRRRRARLAEPLAKKTLTRSQLHFFFSRSAQIPTETGDVPVEKRPCREQAVPDDAVYRREQFVLRRKGPRQPSGGVPPRHHAVQPQVRREGGSRLKKILFHESKTVSMCKPIRYVRIISYDDHTVWCLHFLMLFTKITFVVGDIK